VSRLRHLVVLLVGTLALGGSLAVVAAAPASADSYRPTPGMRWNDPLSRTDKWTIDHHLLRSIASVRRGQSIRIATWSFHNDRAVRALIAAHKRGVSVQLIMSSTDHTADSPNPGFDRLRKALRVGDARRVPAMRSWARMCWLSCRGKGGTSHAKFYLFSKVYRTPYVTMWGSANLTRMAAVGQWNDLYTATRNAKLYNWFSTIYKQMALDRPVRDPLRRKMFGNLLVSVFPWHGPYADGDPVLRELRKVRCNGTTGTTGINGHTRIRVAINAQVGQRGAAIATELHSLRDLGCDVRVVYAQLGAGAYNAYVAKTGRGAVPIKQIVQDFNKDGVYDRYLHMKAISISGIYAGRTNAAVTFWGSANWSPLALRSDETFSRLYSVSVANHYASWIDHLYTHQPAGAPVQAGAGGARVDPWAKFEND
jgi:phosphatidylserine/phosphatidylglycerophosphate/cardiolipin synthase-like enzyme